jgi:transposase
MPSRSAQRAKPPAFVICVQTIENFFCDLKQFRRIATRYDKIDQSFTAMIHLAASFIALK